MSNNNTRNQPALAERVGRALRILRLDIPSRKNETTQSRCHFHLHYGHARHAGAGVDRAGVAETGPELSRRRRAERGENVRNFRDRLCPDAVCFFADARGVVGPVRAPAGGVTVEFRAGTRLRRHGAGADARLALRRPRYFWNHGGEYYNRDGLCRGRRSAGKTGGRVRHDWCGVWRGVRARPGPRRLARQFRSAAPVLGRRRIESGQCALRIFRLPESLPAEKRKRFTLRRANPVGSLVLLRSHPELFRLATIQFIGYVAHEVFNVWALYTIFRYAWREGTIGLSLALVGLCSIVISSWMVPAMVSRFGERRTLYSGQFFGALGMVFAGLATSGTFFFLSIPVMMLWTISSPAAQGMMTRRVSESEQGELQGAIGSLCSLAWIIGPGLFTFTFAYFIDSAKGSNLPGAPWYLGAFLLFVAMFMATRIPKLIAQAEPLPATPSV